MTFNVEVLLKGREDVVETEIDFEGPEPAAWATTTCGACSS